MGQTARRFETLTVSSHGGVTSAVGAQRYSGGHLVGDREGIWGRWNWDGQELVAECDRYGMFPVFYTADEQMVAISESPLALIDAGVSAAPDLGALAVFFRLGFFLGNDTPFRAIHVLPPGGVLRWRPGRMTLDSAQPPVEQTTLSRNQALDEFIERFRRAIAKRPPTGDSYVLPLSGGRDSRHILIELCRQGLPPAETLTLGESVAGRESDGWAAGEISAALGVPNRILTANRRADTSAEFAKNVLTHMCADEHDWFQPLAEALPGLTSCTYSGVAGTWEPDGGTALTAEMSVAFQQGRIADIPELLYRHYDVNEGRLQRLLHETQYSRVPRRAATERILAELDRHAHAPNPLGSFWFWNRERREHGLTPFALMSDVPTVYVPFLDCDVFDLLASLPAGYLCNPSFHTDAIVRGYPEYAGIAFASRQTSMIQRSRGGGQARALKDLARFAMTHNRGRLPSVAEFAMSRMLRRSFSSMRMTAYVIQLEAITGRQWAAG